MQNPAVLATFTLKFLPRIRYHEILEENRLPLPVTAISYPDAIECQALAVMRKATDALPCFSWDAHRQKSLSEGRYSGLNAEILSGMVRDVNVLISRK